MRQSAGARAAGDIESAEAEVYAARTSADQRVATAEARLAEEIQRRRDAETEADEARADREQADDATAQAIARMEELEGQLAGLRTSTAEEIQRTKVTAEGVCGWSRGARRRTSMSSRPSTSALASTPYSAAWSASTP